jgi:hypothetical protein
LTRSKDITGRRGGFYLEFQSLSLEIGGALLTNDAFLSKNYDRMIVFRPKRGVISSGRKKRLQTDFQELGQMSQIY